MNFKTLKIFASLTVASLVTTGMAVACGGGEPEELEIPVSVEGESMRPETIKVKQGDMVTLKIQVEEAGEFHLHGYDIEQDIEEGQITDFFFVADATGRFKITFHHSEEDEEEETNAEGHERGTEENHEDDEDEEIEIGFMQVDPR